MNPGNSASEHLHRYPVKENHKTEEYLAISDEEGLLSLVQMGVLEIHVWGSLADNIEKPDRITFDLDPGPGVAWSAVLDAARQVKVILDEFELASFVKTTGGKGLHVVVPIRRTSTGEKVKAFSRAVAQLLVRRDPDRYVATMSKAARNGKIFVDYLRNDRGSTAIAPYSTRARPGATVSVPIRWDELSNRLHSDHFTIRNLPARLARLRNDPWADLLTTKQSLTVSMQRALDSLQ